mgnify:CR=1 FL=1
MRGVLPSPSSFLGGLALILIALLAYQLRLARAPASQLTVGSHELAPEWLVDDPDAAYHLRRVELTLANGHVPSSDVFLNHPDGSPVPWPPFFDGALAAYALMRLGAPPVDEHGGHFIDDAYEARLENLLVYLPPWLGVWTTLAVGFAAWVLVKRSGARGAARIAAVTSALVYSCTPLAVWYGDIARIDHHVAIALLFALHIGILGWVLGEREEPHPVKTDPANRAVDATWGGLLAGILAGLALLTWLASAVFIGLAGVTLFLASLSADEKRSRSASRAGTLYFLSAAGVTFLPSLGSAWNETQPGSLINLTTGVPIALLAAAFAFEAPALMAGIFRKERLLARSMRAGISAVAALLAVFALPGFWSGVREGASWASRNNLFMDVVDESRPLVEVGQGALLRGVIQDMGWTGLLIPLFLVALGWSIFRGLQTKASWLSGPAAFYLLLNLIVFGVMTISQRRFGNSLAVPMAVSAGVLASLATTSSVNRARVIGGALLLFILGGSAMQIRGQMSYSGMDETRAWRTEVLAGLRWMREATPAGGDWQDPDLPKEYGVLSAWHVGHLIEYHARRPILATNFGSFVGPEHFADSGRLLLGEDEELFVEELLERELDYVVVTARQASDIASLSRVAGFSAQERARWFQKSNGRKGFSKAVEETMLWRLALENQNDSIPGMERVWASSKAESIFGGSKPGPRGPIVSVWRRVPTTE